MERVADGVWLLRGDLGKSMNIYFIEGGYGVVEFDGEVAGFRVIHFPGHARGPIGLWRESDRLALVSDVI